MRVMCVCAQLPSYVQLCDPMNYNPPGCFVHGDSPAKNTRMGCHFLLQGIFLTQPFNPHLHLHWQVGSLPLSRLGSNVYYTVNMSFFKLECSSSSASCSVVGDSLQPHGLQPTGLLRPWDFPGNNSGAGCHFLLLQGIFLTQGYEPIFLMSPALAGGFFTTSLTWEAENAALHRLVPMGIVTTYSFYKPYIHILKTEN